MRMLFRFYDVDSGNILIDGQNIAECSLDSVRGIMGVVPQDTVLFHDTIRYNVRYGRRDATDAEVDDAADGAEIFDSITAFPKGFDTIVGEVS
jgi:ABC-type transport system involved in Fe-S cluster assembly fused permease/ATPase subunit